MSAVEVVAALSFIVSMAALWLSVVKHGVSKRAAAKSAKAELGRKYAGLAWLYAKAQRESGHSGAPRTHAVHAFIVIDASADGKRDFTDKEVGIYVDEAGG